MNKTELIEHIAKQADISKARRLMGYEPLVDFADGMRRTLSRVGVGVSVATSVMRSRFWPVVGVFTGLKAGLASLKRAPGDRPPRRSGKVTKFAPTRLAPKDASDLEAEQRFAYEGGMSHARG